MAERSPVTQTTIKRAICAAKAADLPVTSVKVMPDGTVIISTTPEPEQPVMHNDWD